MGRHRFECGSPTDTRDDERDRSTIDQSSASFDPDRQGIGSTPYGDVASSRVFVPTGQLSGNQRYLIRLAALSVETGEAIRIRGLRQAVGIGVLLKGGTTSAPLVYPLEMDQVSPFWSFSDGNISWHLRAIYGPSPDRARNRPISAGQSVAYAAGIDSALLVNPSTTDLFPPARGYPPGQPIGALGTFRDLRFPWLSQGGIEDIDIELRGPVIVAFFASVRQTDPATRQTLSPLVPATFNAPLPEDQFLLDLERASPALPGAIYRHVSGSIIAETGQVSRTPGINPVLGKTPR